VAFGRQMADTKRRYLCALRLVLLVRYKRSRFAAASRRHRITHQHVEALHRDCHISASARAVMVRTSDRSLAGCSRC
jgi:hypothetical protein